MGDILFAIRHTGCFDDVPNPEMGRVVWTIVVLELFSCAVANAFNPLQHSGPASPYFNAPPEDNISEATPNGCVIDQAAYIVRHGS